MSGAEMLGIVAGKSREEEAQKIELPERDDEGGRRVGRGEVESEKKGTRNEISAFSAL
jgi:hypothetical protein